MIAGWARVAAGVGAAVWCGRRLRRMEVAGESMLPTLQPGDRVVVVMGTRARAGDLVAVADPRQPARTVIKRVADVTAGSVTVLGDNPGASTDSRHFGPLRPEAVRGRAVYRYFPAHRRGWILPRGDVAVGTLAGMWTDDVDRVTSSDYLGDLESRPFDEVRTMRAHLRDIEDRVSYLRRLVQGRLDIVAAEVRRRAEGGALPDLAALVDSLPEILSDKIHAPGPGRLPGHLVPPDDDALTVELDAVAPPGCLASLNELSDDELRELVDQLQRFERNVSQRRRALFTSIDAIQAEVTRRYKTGEATAESLLEEGTR